MISIIFYCNLGGRSFGCGPLRDLNYLGSQLSYKIFDIGNRIVVRYGKNIFVTERYKHYILSRNIRLAYSLNHGSNQVMVKVLSRHQPTQIFCAWEPEKNKATQASNEKLKTLRFLNYCKKLFTFILVKKCTFRRRPYFSS